MSRSPKLCIYCGNTGVTKEHFWGKWSRKHAPVMNSHNNHRIERNPDFDLNGIKFSKKGSLDRPGSSRSQTMKIACGDCNRGWMKSNVDAAIPVLTRMNYGYWGNVTPEETESLVRWIAQFTMSFEFADRETAMIPQSVRTEFALTGKLTGHWLIAIGPATPMTGSEPVFHRALEIFRFGENSGPMQITVFMFGMLLIVSIYSSFKTPLPITNKIRECGLRSIYPTPSRPIHRPFNQFDDDMVPELMEGITKAFEDWAHTI